ncbi:MAG: NAD-dependent deacylase [Bacteroidetes bacterium]|nr:NAD-dependent deacylase [Bacteroidota bacterium]
MKKLVIFSGAGMSAESGISTFRDADGLWERHSLEDVATPEAWRKNPELVHHFYNQRRKQMLEVQPNLGHQLIAALNKNYTVSVITQNIDDLHERAGSQKVLHLHGEITKSKSSGPNQERSYYPIDGWELSMKNLCPEGYPLRPHVVWFGEEVPLLEKAAEIIRTCDILIVIGTSLQVYPAAGLIHIAPPNSEKVLIDPKANEMQIPLDFDVICENAGLGLKKWAQKKGLNY